MITFKGISTYSSYSLELEVESQGLKILTVVQFGAGIDNGGEEYVDDAVEILDIKRISFLGKEFLNCGDWMEVAVYKKDLMKLTGIDFDSILNTELKKLMNEGLLKNIAFRMKPQNKLESLALNEFEGGKGILVEWKNNEVVDFI